MFERLIKNKVFSPYFNFLYLFATSRRHIGDLGRIKTWFYVPYYLLRACDVLERELLLKGKARYS
jgi:hypothetical protein